MFSISGSIDKLASMLRECSASSALTPASRCTARFRRPKNAWLSRSISEKNWSSPSNSAGRQHYGFSAEEVKSTALAIVSKCPGNATAVLQQGDDCVFHEHVEAQMDSMVLKSANHLQAGTVAHMS